MTISKFILAHMEEILVEWEDFAASFGAVTEQMSSRALRDHAKQILEFVARDMQRIETPAQKDAKSHGESADPAGPDSASTQHGRLRYESGFSLPQLIAEYRALRASVLKLWQAKDPVLSREGLENVMRFNEAIDESLANATVAYAEKVNETRDLFLAVLGHDLRSPLAATATAGSYLSHPGAFGDRVQQIGIKVKRSAATMTGIVNDLLSLARTQLGDGIPIERAACDLLEMSQWAIEDANAAYPQAYFELITSGDLTGTFDQARLQQLLTNLANNAAQYGLGGKPIVVDVTGEPDRVVFKVRNQGNLIPENRLSTLFTSMVQLPMVQGQCRPLNSLGLGLYIAKQIALAHGGDITATSSMAMGTVFTASIPRS